MPLVTAVELRPAVSANQIDQHETLLRPGFPEYELNHAVARRKHAKVAARAITQSLRLAPKAQEFSIKPQGGGVMVRVDLVPAQL